MASVNKRSQFYLPPTRASTNGMSDPAFTPELQIITALADGKKLSWPGWLVEY